VIPVVLVLQIALTLSHNVWYDPAISQGSNLPYPIPNMKSLLTLLILSFSLTALLSIRSAYAQTPTPICKPIFGGGTTCNKNGNLLINKALKHPTTGAYVETIPQGMYLSPNQELTFRITVINDNNSSVSNISITDKFPALLIYTGGAGKFETTTRTLTIPLEKLNGNESKSFIVTARVAGADRFSRDQAVTCLANQAQVKAGNRFSSDNVQFCVQTGEIAPTVESQNTLQTQRAAPTPIQQTGSTTKGGLPVHPVQQATQSPSTGPEILSLIGLLPAAIGGYLLRRDKYHK